MILNRSKIYLISILVGISIFAFAPGNWTPAWVVNHDKFVHAVVFFGLSVLISLVFTQLKLYQHFASLMFLAVLIEGIQYALVNRGFSFQDIVFDLLGVLVFYTLVYTIKFLGYSKLL